MGLVEVSAINYIVMSVGACTPLQWDYQEEDSRTEYQKLYKVKGMPLMSKDADIIHDLAEIVEVPKEGREVEIIIDSPVNVNTLILVQEVLNHGATSVGTYQNVTPNKNENGEAMYTGIVMSQDEDGSVQIFTMMGDLGKPEMWVIVDGLKVQEDGVNAPGTVKLGGAIRFLAKDSDILSSSAHGEQRIVAHIDVINKYV